MYYPCFIYVSILLETTTVYFSVSILWICLCVMYKASIVWSVDSLVGCMDPAIPFMIYVSFWCSKTSLTSFIFRYGCINSFSVWSTNSLLLDAMHWFFCSFMVYQYRISKWCASIIFLCVICEFYISLYDIPFLYCYRMYDINAIIYFFCMLLPIRMH